MMTKREKIAKSQIIDKLLEGGYRTYAELFDLFELHLTTRPGVVGYMLPDMAEIWVSEYLDIEQVSLVIRHEILHEYYEHMNRYKAMFKNGQIPKDDPFLNIAADYEVSNVGYTEQDKIDAKKIKIGDKEVEGLVTSIDKPELADKTFEEIYEALKKESPGSMKQPSIGNRGDQQLEQAERAKARAEALREQAEEMGEGAGSGGSGQDGDSSQQGQSGQGSDSGSGGDQDDSSGSGSGDQSGDEEGSSGDGGDGDEDSGQDGEDGKDQKGGKKKSRQKYDDEEYKNMTPEEKKKERARRRKEAAKKLKEQADKLINEINEVVDDIKDGGGDPSGQPGGPGGEGSGNVFETPEEQKARAEAVKRINEKLADLESAARAKDEATSAIMRESAAKAANDSGKYRNTPLTRFTESLNRFIKDSTARARNASWAHINKKYVNSGLLRPGSSYSSRGDVPLINVYFDQSGSWDVNKIETGKQAVATLYKYQTRGEIKVNLYYFDTKVKSEPVGLGGGTKGRPVIEHISQTKPNNVIILTDGDITDIGESITVPGAVWILFYPEVYGPDAGTVVGSPNLVQHLKGRQLTRVFAIGNKVNLAPGITANGWSGGAE